MAAASARSASSQASTARFVQDVRFRLQEGVDESGIRALCVESSLRHPVQVQDIRFRLQEGVDESASARSAWSQASAARFKSRTSCSAWRRASMAAASARSASS